MARYLFKMKQLLPYTLGTLLIAGACNSTEKKQDMQPPVAKTIPHELSMHGDTRIDPYYWLNERENPEVIAYLEAENAYAEASLAHTKGLQEQLFKEMKGRIKEDDMNVPYFENGYWYYSRFAKGQDYPIYCRKKGSQDAPEEIMFDVNVYAKGHEYFSLTGVRVSPDNQLALYFVDSVGRRQYTMRAKNLATGEEMGLNIYPTNGAAAWANDNRTLFTVLPTNKPCVPIKFGKPNWVKPLRHDLFFMSKTKPSAPMCTKALRSVSFLLAAEAPLPANNVL